MKLYGFLSFGNGSGFATTLRFYEQAGLPAASERPSGGYRLYDPGRSRTATLHRPRLFGVTVIMYAPRG